MTTEINVLKLTLHGHLMGYLAGAKNGRNAIRGPVPPIKKAAWVTSG